MDPLMPQVNTWQNIEPDHHIRYGPHWRANGKQPHIDLRSWAHGCSGNDCPPDEGEILTEQTPPPSNPYRSKGC